MELTELCNEIMQICRGHGANEWSDVFNSFVEKIKVNGAHSVKSEIRYIYGGMGSFNDLVLQQDGQVYIEANNRLALLRASLYKLLME